MTSSAQRRSTATVVVRFAAAQVAILVVCWLIFLGRLTGGEALVGGLSIAVATAVSTVAYVIGVARFRPRLVWFADLWRVPGYVLEDSWVVAAAFIARSVRHARERSRFVAVPFRPGGSTARGEARRALAAAFTTLAPNCIVLDVDREHQMMLMHQVRPAPTRQLARRLGAGARPRRSARRGGP